MYGYILNFYQPLYTYAAVLWCSIRRKWGKPLLWFFKHRQIPKQLNQKSGSDSLSDGKFILSVDWMRNLEVGIPDLLEDGINLLVYAGEYDLICNWLGMYLLLMYLRSVEKFNEWIDRPFSWWYAWFQWVGNSRWVHAMEWSGQKEFATSLEVPFVVDGSEAGLLKRYGPLTFLKVFIFLSSPTYTYRDTWAVKTINSILN